MLLDANLLHFRKFLVKLKREQRFLLLLEKAKFKLNWSAQIFAIYEGYMDDQVKLKMFKTFWAEIWAKRLKMPFVIAGLTALKAFVLS